MRKNMISKTIRFTDEQIYFLDESKGKAGEIVRNALDKYILFKKTTDSMTKEVEKMIYGSRSFTSSE